MIVGMSLAEETEAGSGDYRERLLALVEEKAPPEQAASAKAFAAAYVRRLADLKGQHDARLLALLQALYRLYCPKSTA